MSDTDEIEFEERGGVGFITLNRPKALNALTLDMIQAMMPKLQDWREDPVIKAVVIAGAGDRAFCAGGDVRAVYEAGRNGGSLTKEFFRDEYRLNRMIHVFPKPYVALIDGITMGGGVGLSVHGSHRVATEKTMLAMPETGIGLFPDVGGSFFLPRLPGKLGLFLALTGWRLGAADAVYSGLATDFVPSDKIPQLVDAFAGADWNTAAADAVVDQIIDAATEPPEPSALAQQRDAIDRCFSAPSVEAILEALDAEPGDWAAKIAKIIRKQSPTSLKVTFEQVHRGATMDFDSAMVEEFRLSQAFMAGKDFYEGIRAVLVDKDQKPNWQPGDLQSVTPGIVEAHFRPLGDGDLTFS
ncbi:enoyl-CoA hydratase/isomerase family protein [Pelagibius litoralis]|uniref:3-hydroxyisobutyryl-CoA hydrolase n=1 Tax=Pelagibius litoralis TaxID=374515 RepID=A0A967C647_9PROT|nr:enoyl-CoA hydratase/isomerase family protein [Pelagibius litoralis]NIA67027.1 enoyl-CoA hydratase/isomerase family protein [Pelagibius litoralis]